MNDPIIYRQGDVNKPAAPEERRRPPRRSKRGGKNQRNHKPQAKAPVVKEPADKRTNLERQQQYHVEPAVAEFYNAIWPSLRVIMNVAERKERDRLRNAHARVHSKNPAAPPCPEATTFDLNWTPPKTNLNSHGGPFNDLHQMEAGLAQLLQRQGVPMKVHVLGGPGQQLSFFWHPPETPAEVTEEAAAA